MRGIETLPQICLCMRACVHVCVCACVNVCMCVWYDGSMHMMYARKVPRSTTTKNADIVATTSGRN